jgi:hypothetical protein
MQIKKKYQNIRPELLFDELKDLITNLGAIVVQSKMETYSMPDDSSSFISRGILTFRIKTGAGKADKECVQAHIVGSARGETKLLLDIDEHLFTEDRISSLQDDLEFILGSYEIKPKPAD